MRHHGSMNGLCVENHHSRQANTPMQSCARAQTAQFRRFNISTHRFLIITLPNKRNIKHFIVKRQRQAHRLHDSQKKGV